MKNYEIALKSAFLLGTIFLFYQRSFHSIIFYVFLAVALVLGIVLIVNKDSSYNFYQTAEDYSMRRIEGLVLIIFSLVFSYVIFFL